MDFTVSKVIILFLIAFKLDPVEMVKATKKPITEQTSDKEMEKKACDPKTPEEAREAAYQCMVTHFPPKVLMAVDNCTKEAVPDFSDRMRVARRLCDDKNSKRKLANCIRAKSLFLLKDLTPDDIEGITTRYRACAKKALDVKPMDSAEDMDSK